MSELFDPIFGAQRFAELTGDAAWLRALCTVERELAAAAAEAGLIEAGQATVIAAACAELAERDPARLGAASVADGNPVSALVSQLRDAVAEQPGGGAAAAGAVHLGATSQDVLDTAAMLISGQAVQLTIAELRSAAGAAAGLAAQHRDTPMAARTLLQQAAPTTFGAVAMHWTAGLDRAVSRLELLQRDGLPVQLGGAAGTLASIHPAGRRLRGLLASRLGLRDPGRPWHAERSPVTELAAALALAATAVGKVATDLVLLAQTEVGEVRPHTGGGSSAMPHKHNPVAAITARAAAMQAPGLLATVLSAAGGQEYQRAAGGWHAEWLPMNRLIQSAGGAASQLAVALTTLVVEPAVMRANLDAGGDALLAERISRVLTPELGYQGAVAAVRAALVSERGFAAALADSGLAGAELDALLDPAGYLGDAGDLVDDYLRGRQP